MEYDRNSHINDQQRCNEGKIVGYFIFQQEHKEWDIRFADGLDHDKTQDTSYHIINPIGNAQSG